MKTQVKKTGQHRRELTVEVEGDTIKKKFDEVYKRLNKEAKVPGFRQGNVPRDILEKHYSAVAHQEALKELLPEVYNQALGETQLEPVSLPEISDVNLGKDNLSFKASLEIKPKIEVRDYKGLKLEYKPIEVSEEEINKALDKFKQNYNQMPEEDLAHSLGYPDFEALKKILKMQIYLEKSRAQQINLENSVIEHLLKQVNFQIPESLVTQQLDRLQRQAEVDLALRGMSKQEIEKQRQALKENLKPEAEKQVHIYLVLEEVARRENISRDDKMTQRAIEFLLRQADWKGGKHK
ncbi:MAG: trigger factor [Candidatus Omnitrophota bacterium]